MADIAALGISIDSSAAIKATSDLDAFVGSATRAADANSRLAGSSAQAATAQSAAAGAQTQSAAATTASATAAERLIASLQRQIDLFNASDAALAAYNAQAARATAAQTEQIMASAAMVSQLQAENAQRAQFYAATEAATAAGERFVASLRTQADTLGMSKEQMLEYRAAQLGVTEEAAPFIAAITAAGAGETEEAATARYQAVAAAAQQWAASQSEASDIAARYAASIDEVAAAATRAEAAEGALSARTAATSATLTAQNAAMSAGAGASAGASATGAGGAAETGALDSTTAALQRQLYALTASRAELVAYDAEMAGASEAETAYAVSIAQAVTARQREIALATEYAAAIEAEAAAANAGAFGSMAFTRELAVIFRELAEGRITYAVASFTRLLSFTNLLAVAFNPVTIALGVLGVAAVKGAEQFGALNNALISTGNFSGTSAGELDAVAQAIGATGERTGVATTALTALAASGRFTAEQIGTIGAAATATSDVTGTAVDKVVQQFVRLSEDPVKASAELNAQYHYLTTAVFEQIDALAKQGDAVAAADAAENAYASALKDRADSARDSMGTVATGWHAVEDAASSAWNAMLGIGKPETLQDQLSQVNKSLAAARGGAYSNTTAGNLNTALGSTETTPVTNGNIAELEQTQTRLQNESGTQREGEARQSSYQQTQAQGIAAQQTIDRIQQETDKRSDLTKAIDQERAAVAALAAAGTPVSAQDQATMEAGLTKRYTQRTPGAAAAASAQADQPQVELTNQFQAQTKLQTDQTKILDDDHKARLVSDQSFYDQENQLNDQDLATKLTYYTKLEALLTQDMNASSTSSAVRIRDAEAIAKAQSEQNVAIAGYAAQSTQISDQVVDANQKQTDAVNKYIQSLNDQIAKQNEADAQKVEAAGGPTRGRAQGTGEAGYETQVNMRGAQQISDIQAQTAPAGQPTNAAQPYTPQQGATLQAAVQQADATMIANHQAAMAQVTQADSSWENGAINGWSNWSKQASNMSGQVSTATTGLLNGLTDDLLKFAETGKANFEGLAESFAAALAKMEIQAAESKVFGLINSALPGGSAANSLGMLSSLFGSTSAAGGLGLSTGANLAGSIASTSAVQGFSSDFNAFSGAFSTGIAGFASGGHITGPGTGTSDSIPARLSNGEFVVNAAATSKHLSLLHSLNGSSGSGTPGKTHFADGGVVNGGSPPSSTPGTNIAFHITTAGGTGGNGGGSGGTSAQGQNQQAALQRELQASVIEIVRRHSLPGGQINQIIRTANTQ